jgi:hypothetical protein
LLEHYSYESRADAYVKTRQWDRAIRDLTTAISLQVGGSVLLMSIDQFRAIYPEYKSASNEAIGRKLQQTFYPDLTYEAMSEFLTRPAMGSTVIPDLYLKRSDAYLKKAIGAWPRSISVRHKWISRLCQCGRPLARNRSNGGRSKLRRHEEL